MTKAAKTVFYFGIYMLLEGLILLLVPNLLLSFVGLPDTQEIWVRFVGIALLVLGYYYLQAARSELKLFFTWTVQVRIVQFFLVLGVVGLTASSPVFLVFAGIELLFGLWTYATLKSWL